MDGIITRTITVCITQTIATLTTVAIIAVGGSPDRVGWGFRSTRFLTMDR